LRHQERKKIASPASQTGDGRKDIAIPTPAPGGSFPRPAEHISRPDQVIIMPVFALAYLVATGHNVFTPGGKKNIGWPWQVK
jgi:hypothetical protein